MQLIREKDAQVLHEKISQIEGKNDTGNRKLSIYNVIKLLMFDVN